MMSRAREREDHVAESRREMLALRRFVSGRARLAVCRSLSGQAPRGLPTPDEMSLAMRRRIAALEGFDSQITAVEEEYHTKIRELEEAFHKSSELIVQRRQSIIDGADEPTAEEVERSTYDPEDSPLPETVATEEAIGIPHFWPTAFRVWHEIQRDGGALTVSDADYEVLEYLKCIRVSPWQPPSSAVGVDEDDELADSLDFEIDGPGFSIHFSFEENPYLEENDIALYCFGNGEVAGVEEPQWKPGANPTVKLVTKTKKRKGQPAEKLSVEKSVPSFFQLFQYPDYEGELAGGDDGEDDSPIAEMQEVIIPQLRGDLVPRAGIYYIHGLEGGDMYPMDEEDVEWEEPPPPPRGRR